MKNKIITVLMIVALLASLIGCNAQGNSNLVGNSDDGVGKGKLKIVTTLFPQYDFVRQVAGDKVEVILLVPPGVEAHAYEPTPQDIVTIQKSDLFIYTGEVMEPWAHKIIETVGTENIQVIEAASGIALVNEEHEEEHEHEEESESDDHDDHNHEGSDPHVWLDPIYAQQMVETIVDGLVKASPENMELFKLNADTYKYELQSLHEDFEQIFEHTKYDTIMSGGHFAFGHFIERYGLKYESPYNGFAPDAEPTPKRIAQLIESIKASGIKAIYYEELVDPKVAKIVAEEADAEMLMLHAAHNLSKEELNSGITYIEIMRNNMESLKKGLVYEGGE